MKAFLIFLFKLALTGLCLWWAFSQINIDGSIFTKPGAVDYRWLAGGAALAGLSLTLHATRWWFFLRGQSLPVSLGRAVELTMIDSLFSLASVSGIGGDAARIILLMRDHPGKKLIIATAVMADHLAGLVSIALLFFIISVTRFEALADQSVLGRGVIHFSWFYMGGGLALVLLTFICASPPVHRRIHENDRFGRWPVLKQFPELYDVYRKNWRYAVCGLAVSFLMLGAYFSSYYCGMRAVGGKAEYGAVMSAMPVIDSVSGMPISVAGVGVREKLFEVLMNDLAGVPAETAIAASLAGFACNVLWALLGALFFLKKRDRISAADLEDGKVD
ncbi:flippase-like domain-containing protein [Luteolibacter yonseiensis]|uniref:Flippase-like domain-containing protein n=1 Tax=Luteolibacter yonseiensis TaxID=1144680 RepID=A0A934VC68_9BACT|nr:lysylphosphatidylglycerol synthase transmembrane domain-containing protein [Luteolibacter yonseiensis]MBK1816174.1 flippase-like domain-containing protein [Luteolibacter yonseiensis]